MAKKKTSFQDRIVGLELVDAADLIPHPLNWRTHPERQREAFRKILEAIGIVGAIIVFKDEDGRFVIIDGHLRQEMLTGKVQVLVTDLSADEAMLLLSARDPLAALAGQDEEKRNSLCRDIQDSELGEGLGDVLSDLFEVPDVVFEPDEIDTPLDLDKEPAEKKRDLVIHFRDHRVFLDESAADAIETSLNDWVAERGLLDDWANDLTANIAAAGYSG